jgi:hypothetical protein
MEEETWTRQDQSAFFAEADAQSLRELNAKLLDVIVGSVKLLRRVQEAAAERGIELWP